jgi:hypothetical protein
MADTPERDTKKTKTVSDWVNRPARPESAGLEQRRRLWEALAEFVASQGGWVTSLPGVKDLRIECPAGSALPSRLIELGYSPRHCGSSTRITPTGTVEAITKHSSTGQPIIHHHAGIVPVDILEISLPGK